MTTRKLGIRETYHTEIEDILNLLQGLEAWRVYEKTNAKMDGALETSIRNVKKMFIDLIDRIDNQSPSKGDVIDQIFESKK